MTLDENLGDVFRSIERSHAGCPQAQPSDDGDALVRNLKESAAAPDAEEFQYTVKHDWEKFVLLGLLKRYGIRAYRYRKQREATILMRVNKTFMNEVLWPVFREIATALASRFNEVTKAFLPAIAPAPFSVTILNHQHGANELCDDCRRRLLEEA